MVTASYLLGKKAKVEEKAVFKKYMTKILLYVVCHDKACGRTSVECNESASTA